MALSRKERRRIRRSNYEGNLKLFRFFLQVIRLEICDFTGSKPVETVLDLKAPDAKFCFTAFNNGEYNQEDLQVNGIKTKHPNVLQALIMGKKGWGLWMQEYANGVAEFSFTESEILEVFEAKKN